MATRLTVQQEDTLNAIADKVREHTSYTLPEANHTFGARIMRTLFTHGWIFTFDGRVYLTDDGIDMIFPA